MGIVVCGRVGAVGGRYDRLSAPPHRSGVPCVGGSVCADVCPSGLEVELCGDGTPHDRTRREIGMKRNVQQPVVATARKIRVVRFEDHLCTAATTKEFLVVQLEGIHTLMGCGQTGENP